jgi:diguanylate cyclase (GGDEF)-like protein/PAS domain S-box-containing protein
MLTVYDCIVHAHDLRLVAVAAIICALASFTTINLTHHVLRSEKRSRRLWLGVAATASGFGIWATHFVAMLAYSPGVESGYNISLTIVSLLAAMLLTGVGLEIALSPAIAGARWIGGGVIGGGIAVMHFTGMAAYEVAGRVHYDPWLVLAALVFGVLFAAAALAGGLRDWSMRSTFVGAALLTLAICGLHFTAMAAASMRPDPTIVISPGAVPEQGFSVLVSLVAFAVLLLTLAGLALDVRERRNAASEADRMRALANAAFEGLMVCDGETIITVNASLATLVGVSHEQLIGANISRILPGDAARRRFDEKPNVAFETTLKTAADAAIWVEVICRQLDFAGKPRRAIAIRDLRDRKKAEQDIHFLAHHDPLTGLANRNTFNEKLDQLIDAHQANGLWSGRHLAVLCLDLDRFKEVNDLFGHAAGDELLRSVGIAISGALTSGQMLARLGGDEFAIVAPGLSDPTLAGRLAEKVLEALRGQSHSVAGGAMVSTSIGIATFPLDASDRASIMSHADTALYRAKAEGRGTFRFFESAMGEQLRDRRQIEHDLRFAISRGELHLVYQPQARADNQEVVGFEALVRWKSPSRGSIPPGVFIPIAEESGFIIQIGEWVLREACREAANWTEPLRIAVNVSAIQLHSPQFARLVHEVLIETGLSAARLELEITETALIRDFNRAIATLRQLKNLGVRIDMDDFGTGYSSLSNLRAFPFDKIKIDASFIKSVTDNPQAATIVRAVLGLGRGLGLPVLAEGVETAEELAFLVKEACPEVQGYYLGRPQSIDAFMNPPRAEAAAPASRSLAS